MAPAAGSSSAATDYLAEEGLGDRSLRSLATAIGTSHRMLNYHFGSRDGLLVEVCREAEHRQRLVLSELLSDFEGPLEALPARFFELLLAPGLAPLERLFFEIYAEGLQGRAWATPLLEDVVDSWVRPFVPALVERGWSEPAAVTDLRLGVAVTRGLLLDALATGDYDDVRRAFERHLAGLQSLRQPAGRARAPAAPLGSFAVTRHRPGVGPCPADPRAARLVRARRVHGRAGGRGLHRARRPARGR